MDFMAGRSGGAKYGKNKGRAQLHNFYDIPKPTLPLAPKQFPISPSSPGQQPVEQDKAVSQPEPPSPSPTRALRPAHVTSHSRSSASTGHGSLSASPVPLAARSSDKVEESAFDMLSSEDDSEGLARRPIKKIRLSPVDKLDKLPATRPRSRLSKKQDAVKSILANRNESIVEQRPQDSVVPSAAPCTTETEQRTSQKAIESTNEKAQARTKKQRVTHGIRHQEKTKAAKTSEDLVMHIPENQEPTPRKSRTKLRSRPAKAETPRKPKPQPFHDSDTSGASPSQLGMGYLNLTTDNNLDSPSRSPSPSASRPAHVLARGRKRLGEGLDTATSQPQIRAELAARNFAKQVERLHQGNETDSSHPTNELPELERSVSSQTRQLPGRSRNTYAKERSHLSDMLDDVDALSATSSQQGSQQLLSEMTTTGPSHLQSQFEIESDSSDEGPTFRLKNIHELKQAGSISRLEKEVEDIMSDVNPHRGSKALRLQALMQTVRKLPQENFKSYLFEHAFDRLISWSPLVKDKVSKLLLGMVFGQLVHCEAISPARLKLIIQCVMANSSSLPPLESMVAIGRHREENLAKSTIRDLSEFEQTVLFDGLLPAYEGSGIVPAAVTLGVLNDSLRKIVDMGTVVPLPQSSYIQITALLSQASQPSSGQAVQHVFVAKLALSLLQICVGPLEQDMGLSGVEYVALSNTLADVFSRSLTVHEDLVQKILHFAITLCNDKPHICRAMSQPDLTTQLMSLVSSRLLNIVSMAEDSQEIESTILDSIILSLACLLNLTEHDDEVRRLFAFGTAHGSRATHLSRLIDIFSDAASRLRSVSTTEQTSALITVGYLSLLICNLCLDLKVWQSASEKLSGEYKISDIVASGKELLIHLKAVDTAEDNMANEQGSTAMEGVTARFGEILDAVRLE